MTASVSPFPTSRGLAPLAPMDGADATSGAAAAGQASLSTPGGTGVTASGAFPALLLAMRSPMPPQLAAAHAGAGAPEEPAPRATDTVGSPLDSTLAVLAGNTIASTVDTSDPGKAAGDSLPGSGTDLPPADLDELLAALAAPLAGSMNAAVTAPTEPALPPAVTGAASALAGGRPGLPDAAPLPDGATQAAQPGVADVTRDSPSAVAGWRENTARSVTIQDTVTAVDDPASGSAPDTATERGMELALPAEFRARLDVMLNAVHRPAFTTDGIAGALSGPGLSPATSTPIAAPAGNATDALFQSLPVLQPLNDRDALAQGLGDRLLLMADKGLQSATLKLHPEHLGPMEIRVRIDDDGAAQVLFSAHHAQTRDALEGAIPRLRELFADQGLNLMQANVDSGRSAFGHREYAAGMPPGWNRGGEETDPAAVPAESTWRLARRSEGRVDVLV